MDDNDCADFFDLSNRTTCCHIKAMSDRPLGARAG